MRKVARFEFVVTSVEDAGKVVVLVQVRQVERRAVAQARRADQVVRKVAGFAFPPNSDELEPRAKVLRASTQLTDPQGARRPCAAKIGNPRAGSRVLGY